MKTCDYCEKERRPGNFIHETELGEVCRHCYIDWLEENHPDLVKIIEHHKRLAGG